jgi:hypothetical protein
VADRYRMLAAIDQSIVELSDIPARGCRGDTHDRTEPRAAAGAGGVGKVARMAAADGLSPHWMTTVTWRVYAAEQSTGLGQRFESVCALERFVQRVVGSRWWRKRYAEVGPITVESVNVIDGPAMAFAQAAGSKFGGGYRVVFEPSALTEAVTLHELAHCLQPIWVGDEAQLRSRQRHIEFVHPDPHSAYYARAHVDLVAEFLSDRQHSDLLDAYRHFEVDVAEDIELAESRRLSELFGQRHTAEQERAEEERAAHQESYTGIVPSIDWGDWMKMLRRRSARTDGKRGSWSRTGIVEAVRPIGRYTIADVSALEASPTLPDDARLRRLAMAAAAAYDLDPVWARTALGLARWDCGIELDELSLINADWTARVEHLNSLIEGRPPLWQLDGER